MTDREHKYEHGGDGVCLTCDRGPEAHTMTDRDDERTHDGCIGPDCPICRDTARFPGVEWTKDELPHQCEFGGCTREATECMQHRPNNWNRKTCVTHRLDFIAGSLGHDAEALCSAWGAGTLKVDRPVCGVVRI